MASGISVMEMFNVTPKSKELRDSPTLDLQSQVIVVLIRSSALVNLKIFAPLTIAALLILIPANVSSGTLLNLKKDFVFSDFEKLSILNVSKGSERFWVHLCLAYIFTIWTCFMLYKEYGTVAFMRQQFLASQHRCVEQFTVVVRNVPQTSGNSIAKGVDHIFQKNHQNHYLSHQDVYLSIPHDIYWKNLAIPFVSLSIRRLIISIATFILVFLYMMLITLAQSLANLKGLEKVTLFLRPIIELKLMKFVLHGFLPDLTLKIFLYTLPTVLMILSIVEGYFSVSVLGRRASAKYYYFMMVNVFIGSTIARTGFEQLYSFLYQSPTEIPRTIGVSIPMKATFFITYIMVDGWVGVAAEILRLKPLVIYHLKNMLIKTVRDREKAMDPGSIDLLKNLPNLQLYFLLGLVYAVVTPILLPFVFVFFIFAFLVYRYQIINVYNQEHESGGAFWPHMHSTIIRSLLISQLLLFVLLSTMNAAHYTFLLIILPVLTIWFHKYCF